MIAETKPTDQDEQQRLNAEFGMRLNRETRADPDSPYAGKYIVIADCQIVTVANTLDEMHAQILELGLNPREASYVQASADYETPIWMPIRMELG